jgi:branched-subunit amino acid aminotransferase/4-amino-4-deoxychorismate lyase
MAKGSEQVFRSITKVSQRKFTVEEGKQAQEVFMVGSSTLVSTPAACILH